MTHSSDADITNGIREGSFTAVHSEEEYVVGKTIITIDNTGDGKINHAVTYAGKDKDGNIWVYTKNGRKQAPTFQKLDEVLKVTYAQRDNNGNKTKDGVVKAVPGTVGSGYYNPVKR